MANFGLFKGFSEKLFQGELPTQLGLLGSVSVSDVDADALAFITAANITNITQQNAIITLVESFKTNGIWTKFKAIYPFVGGSASTHKFNLKDPRDLDAAFRLVFSSGWTHSSIGATPNGTSAYADTKLSPSTQLVNNDTHISVYNQIPTSAPKPDVPIGTRLSTSNNPGLFIRYYTSVWQSIQYDGTTFANYLQVNWGANSWGDIKGHWITTRTSSTVHKGIRNGVVLATNTIANTHNIIGLTGNIFIGANGKENNTPFGEYDSTTKSFASVGSGLTDTEASNYYTAVQAFQTTLSRQV